MTELVDRSFAERAERARAARNRRRNRSELLFKLYGIGAIGLALLSLAILLGSILGQGLSVLWQTEVNLEVTFDRGVIDPENTGSREAYAEANYNLLVLRALQKIVPEARSRTERRELMGLVSSGAGFELRSLVLDDPSVVGTTRVVAVPASDEVDMLSTGAIKRTAPESERPINDRQIAWLDRLVERGMVERAFNTRFFTSGDSREPELAGIWAAVVGSALTLLVTALLAFPLGVITAVYLEEFAPKNKWTDLIEVNINNLAAVPSIVFGLLGLAVFLGFFGLPRSAPLVGGMVLALMTLPTIIIASRAALKAVPPSIREAAVGLGASPLQVVAHHVLPLAMPGVLTGSIIGMAQALGETAPLLMIGMVAFIVDAPTTPLDPATVLPVQIYIWADSPERAFVARTAAAILVLLAFLILMNALAVLLRKKFERRW